MFNLKNLFTHALLALMLLTGAGAASAGPTYRVTVNTTTFSGSGYLDFLFSGDAGSAGPATAMLRNFSGEYAAFSELSGDASGSLASGFTFDNVNGFAALLQSINLGGNFGFDLSFDFASEGDGTAFSVALLDENFGTLGADGALAVFQLLPGSPIAVSENSALTSVALVAEVPEPATLASLALGLALIGGSLRARRK